MAFETTVGNPKYPAGGEGLRALAIASVRRALQDCGRECGEGDPLPVELVSVAESYQLPVSSLVAFIHFAPRQGQITPEAFAKHCRAALRQTPAIDDERYPANGEGGTCPQCGTHPENRIGGFWVCASGRCVPRVFAG